MRVSAVLVAEETIYLIYHALLYTGNEKNVARKFINAAAKSIDRMGAGGGSPYPRILSGHHVAYCILIASPRFYPTEGTSIRL